VSTIAFGTHVPVRRICRPVFQALDRLSCDLLDAPRRWPGSAAVVSSGAIAWNTNRAEHEPGGEGTVGAPRPSTVGANSRAEPVKRAETSRCSIFSHRCRPG